GRGERVVQCAQAAVVVFLEHREVDYPQRRPLAGQQIHVMAQLDAQRTQRLGHDLRLVGAEEHDVPIHRTHAVQDYIEVVFGDELDDRRLQTFNTLGALVDLDIGQALGAIDADVPGVIIDLLARQRRTTGHAQRRHATLRIAGRATEYLEVDL